MSKAKWLNDTVFYNIYPQSFNDSNGDGIGDINGIIEKLDYIKDIGFNGIWLNPIYVSPFRDAGYDVADFYKVAPRYGTNEDFKNLAAEAKKRGIKIVMDLVAGHTALECEWFVQSAKPEKNEFSDRYIWTNSVWDNQNGSFINGYSERDGCFMKNFFYCQPALNYGFKNITEPWQLPMNHPACLANRDELVNIMRFWGNMGADGFRVDMAASLVKEDPTKEGIIELWDDVEGRYKKEFPDGILISEWCYPKDSIKAGFSIDFFLQFGLKAYTTLFRYEKGTNQNEEWIGNSYFRKEGKGNINEFLTEYLEHYNEVKNDGYIAIPSGNHDMHRLSIGRDLDDLKVAFAFLMTMPGVPFVYYGDEIGMKYINGLPSKEGGFNRTGSRTPMQWDNTKNHGFSNSDTPYLPTDKSIDAPTVENEINDPNSLLNFVKNLISLRKAHKALCANGDFEVLNAGYPFIYKRFYEDETIFVLVNPSDKEIDIKIPEVKNMLVNNNIKINGNMASVGKQGYMIYEG